MATFMKKNSTAKLRPAQTRARQRGAAGQMALAPVSQENDSGESSRPDNGVASITRGANRIGKAMEISYLGDKWGALKSQGKVEKYGRKCLLFPSDIGGSVPCRRIVDTVVKKRGRRDILVNYSAEQHPQDSMEKIRFNGVAPRPIVLLSFPPPSLRKKSRPSALMRRCHGPDSPKRCRLVSFFSRPASRPTSPARSCA